MKSSPLISVFVLLAIGIPAIGQSAPAANPSTAKFYALTAVEICMTIADIEVTQRCIANHTCREGNPLLPSSRVPAYSVNMGLTAVEAAVGWKMRKRGIRYWWVPQTVNFSAHGIGVGFTLNR